MSLNVPILALSVVGVVLVIAGVYNGNSNLLVLVGMLTILFAWVLQEMTRRRT